MFARIGLSNRLNFIVVVINIIILFIIAAIASASSDAALREQALGRFSAKNDDAQASLEVIFENLYQTTADISAGLTDQEDINDSGALRAFVIDAVSNDADQLIERVNILRNDDSVVSLSFQNPHDPASDYNWRVFRERFPNIEGITDASIDGEIVWFRQIEALFDSEERRTISLAFPYEHAQGNDAIWVDVSMDSLETELRSILNDKGLLADTINGYALLIDANNVPLGGINLPGSIINRDLNRTTRTLLTRLDAANRNSEGLYQIADPLNDEISGFFGVNEFDVNNWRLITVLPEEEIPELPNSVFLPIVVVSMLGVVLLTFVVNRFISQAVVSPMVDLQRSAREIGDGNLRFVVFHQDKEDEIGELASAMESMKNRLRESYDALQQWSRTLEKRVDNRTEQLAAAQAESEATAQQLQAIYDESLSVVNEAQLRPVLDQFMNRILTLLDATFCSIWLGTQDDDNVQMVVTNDPRPRRSEHTLEIPRSEGIVGQTIIQGAPIIVEDYANYEYRINLSEYYEGKANFNKALAVPLMFAGQTIGAVVVGRPHESPSFKESEIRELALFSNLVSPSVRNAQLLVQVREAAAEAATANEVKTRFLASVTHELRTPLNLIINNMDFMRVGAFGDITDEQLSRLNQTVRSAEHLLYLINDLLDVSKIEAGEMQLFIQQNDAHTMLEDAVDNAYALLDTYEEKEGKVELVVDIEEELPEIPMDTRRIRQVLNNLLSNAIKFTSEGAVTLKVFNTEKGMHFSVHDTGIGIPKDEMDLLFAAFERTTAAKQSNIEGTGLGLPISRYLVQQHGGDLTVVSEAGEGSTFAFSLPFETPEHLIGKTTTQQITAILSSKNE